MTCLRGICRELVGAGEASDLSQTRGLCIIMGGHQEQREDPVSAPRTAAGRGGYSAKVRMWLEMGGQVYSVAQVGGGKLYFDQPTELPAMKGEFVLIIDESERRWQVHIEPYSEARRIVDAEFKDC